jgi:hypothetical protein
MRKHRQISAELTPLLDVIMIMLFIIISRSYNAVEKAENEKEQAYSEIQAVSENFENQKSKLEKTAEENMEKLNQAENIIEGYKNFDKLALIISVSIENKSDETRNIIISDGNNRDTISYGWENMRYGENSLNAVFENYIKSADERPVFISFNYKSSEIYMKDFNMITSVIDNIQSRNENVYIMYNEMEDLQ